MVNLISLNIGDAVYYKAYGIRGSYDAVVTGIGLKKVGIKVYSHDGKDIKPYFINVMPKNLRKAAL